jgi:hypothetical protein
MLNSPIDSQGLRKMTEKLLDGSPDLEQAKKEKKKLEKLKAEEVSALFWKLLQPYLPEIRGMKSP